MTSAQLLGNGSSLLATAQTLLELVPQNARSIKVLHNTSSCCYSPLHIDSARLPRHGINVRRKVNPRRRGVLGFLEGGSLAGGIFPEVRYLLTKHKEYFKCEEDFV